jgi:hypothetical protein
MAEAGPHPIKAAVFKVVDYRLDCRMSALAPLARQLHVLLEEGVEAEPDHRTVEAEFEAVFAQVRKILDLRWRDIRKGTICHPAGPEILPVRGGAAQAHVVK